MKKANRKKIIITGLSVVLLLSVGMNLFYLRKTAIHEQNVEELEKELSYVSVKITADEKMRFSKEKDLQYLKESENGMIKEIANEDVEDFIANEILNAESEEEVIKNIELYGIYRLDNVVDKEKIVENIELSQPHVFYNAGNGTWIVSTWGSWNTDNWNRSIVSQSLGKKSQFGVYHSEIEGVYDTHVINSVAYIADHLNKESKSTSNRSGGVVDERVDGEGFYFELQDYTYGFFDKQYVGEKWYGSCTFDGSYEKFGGEVTSHYRP